MNAPVTPTKPDPSHFASRETVRWCPGCGDYAILKGIQRALAERARPREDTVFVSGIGCSSRLPYYLSTYGFHTIHGRAPAVATGIKMANPGLDVWVITGDGDGLSIGGNHMLHALRRDIDFNILLFNNEIYGLTKGQLSPTSRLGTRSPTSLKGSVERPVSAVRFALGAGARFVARALDVQQDRLPEILVRAAGHRGAAFVELLQNCSVYNDGAFAFLTDRETGAEKRLHVRHGEPLRYGADGEFGLRLDARTMKLEAVKVGSGGCSEEEILIHDERNPALAGLLATIGPPAFPVPLGVIYCNPEALAEDDAVAGVTKAEPPAIRTTDADLTAMLASEGTYQLT